MGGIVGVEGVVVVDTEGLLAGASAEQGRTGDVWPINGHTNLESVESTAVPMVKQVSRKRSMVSTYMYKYRYIILM